MFGKIKSIEENTIIIENTAGKMDVNYINYHVVFVEADRKIIGEIIGIKETDIEILLVGEIKNDEFYSGVLKKPNFSTIPRLVYKSEVELFLGSQDTANKSNLYIGSSNIYEGFNVSTDLNSFFSNHFAIIGNTGSGKSCGVARIMQNIFYHNDENMPVNAHIILFDVYGEYNSALSVLNNLSGIGYKSYSTKLDFTEGDILNIPAYFLEVDDLALLLNATTPN
ncbi:MAG: DUF87 domain-containing protein, partial [Bacilli bacterium]|nr:DUF87 domain-containing protein [Bacilli bacterium]